ncbi:MBOAT family O-acyltransferase [Tellurirhabdus rosea]|uniref:MBOAT family O-acyltransferase n=1 Tax=Tellurirhabdus rosea TaxID=2674997 RepID=UPI002258ACB2|nr:MBOAT family O-acyltransferase [Tellurirhabdus rosea]
MLFNSIEFLLFFLLVTPTYFLLPHRYRWLLLLTASCYFYMAFVPVYILILGGTIVVDYFAGIWLENAEGPRRKALLVASLVANIGVLAIFKYYNFLNDNLTALLGLGEIKNPIPALKMLLPIGLSFHTFQAMSYTIEVYRGNQKAERHFGIYALYVMFYPQLVAGPIERPQNVLHQFHEVHKFDYTNAVEGLKRMLWGLVKKLVIADRLALYVDVIYGNTHYHNGMTFLVASVFFAIQIYCDFSAYSDIALGSARVMGFDLMENFRRPYFARTVSEFWSRWHISLTTWFRDYLYIPLGGNRVSVPRWYLNQMIVFMVSGLWHGAAWTFVIWGGLNGFYLIAATATKPWRKTVAEAVGLTRLPGLHKMLEIGFTFLLICLTWVFFRAATVSDAFFILKQIATMGTSIYTPDRFAIFTPNPAALLYAVFGIGLLFLYEGKQEYFSGLFSLQHNSRTLVRHLTYAALVMLIMLLGVLDGGQFIYFQF